MVETLQKLSGGYQWVETRPPVPTLLALCEENFGCGEIVPPNLLYLCFSLFDCTISGGTT